VIGFVADEPLRFPPGSEYKYADTDNFVIALMCEAATGVPYETLLEQLVDGPVGLRGTSLPSGYLLPRPYVHGYAVAPGERPENQSQVLSASGAWASGGMVSTAADLNRFVRAYAGGGLFGTAVRDEQLQFIPGGTSGPPGPGRNSAGLAIFRYETHCGVVYGHTGNFPGYTVLIAATPNGRRSVVFLVNAPLNQRTPREFRLMRSVEARAVCAALA
jgi:D-alanyl-D-alanine carboxypeptidase